MDQLKDEIRKLAHDKIINDETIQRLESQIERTKGKSRDLKLRLADLEASEKRLAGSLAERDRELDRERQQSKTRGSKLEQKLQKKKERIRQLIAEYQEKDQEIDRMKAEL